MIILSRAIRSLYPTAEFIIENEDYDKIRWTKDRPENLASLEELIAEVERLEELDIQNQYKNLRRPEYPPLADLADALYWQASGDNSKMNDYLSRVESVKSKYPKGQA
jgi:hypothetical protein